MTVNNGTVFLGANGGFSPTASFTINGNAAGLAPVLDLAGFNGSINNLTFGGTGQTATSSASVTTGAGTLTLNGNVTTSATGNPTTSASFTGNLELATGTRTFNVANSTGSAIDLNVNGVVSGTGALTKTGAGTLQFTGGSANIYSGLTTVTAGVLELNKTAGINAIAGDGVLAKSGDVLVNGGTLRWLANDQLLTASTSLSAAERLISTTATKRFTISISRVEP